MKLLKMVLLLSFVGCAYSMDESFALIEKIDRMHRPNAQYGGEKQYKLDRVLHLPLCSKNNDNYDVAHGVSAVDISTIQNKKIMHHVDSSVLWQFARLPFELQHKVVDMMMDHNQEATAIFLNTPLLHGFDRYVRVKQLCMEICSDQKVSNVFLHICPYGTKHVVEYISDFTCFDCANWSFLGSFAGLGGAISIFSSVMCCCPTSILSLPPAPALGMCLGGGFGGVIAGAFLCVGRGYCKKLERTEKVVYRLLRGNRGDYLKQQNQEL